MNVCGVCVCVGVCVPGLPGSRDVGCAGKWIVLLDHGAAVSLLVSRMNVGDGGQAYQRVAPQTTRCHARTRWPTAASPALIFPAWVRYSLTFVCGKDNVTKTEDFLLVYLIFTFYLDHFAE